MWDNTRIIRNTLVTLLSVAIPGLLGLVALKPLLRLLGPINFTYLSFFWVYTAHMGFFDFGMSRLMGIEIPKAKESEIVNIIYVGLKKAFYFALLGAGIVFVSWGIGIIVVPEHQYLYHFPVLLLLLIWAPLAVMSLVLRSIFEATGSFNLAAIFRAFNQMTLFLTPWLMAIWGRFGIIEFVTAITALRLISLLIGFFSLYRKHGIPNSDFSIDFKSKGFSLQNKWLTLSNFSGIINGSLDRFMLLSFFGANAIGAYVFAQDFSVRILIFSSSLALVLLPFFAKSANKEHHEKWIVRSIWLLISVHVLIGLYVYYAASLWLEGVNDATWSERVINYFLIFLAGITANGIGHILLSALHSYRELKKPALWHFVSACVYLPLLYVGIRFFGLYGAAIFMSVRSIADMGVLYFFWKQCNQSSNQL